MRSSFRLVLCFVLTRYVSYVWTESLIYHFLERCAFITVITAYVIKIYDAA